MNIVDMTCSSLELLRLGAKVMIKKPGRPHVLSDGNTYYVIGMQDCKLKVSSRPCISCTNQYVCLWLADKPDATTGACSCGSIVLDEHSRNFATLKSRLCIPPEGIGFHR